MATVSALYRHPVKAIGAESLASATLETGRTFPGDRVWAMAHERSRYDFDAPAWARCSTFLRGATFAELMAVTTEGAPGGPMTFRHPSRPDLAIDPGAPEGEAALVDWIGALMPDGAPRPTRLAAAPGRAMTDSPDATISIMSDASRAALSERAGAPLDRRRFRGNLWVAELPPWGEFDWLGRELRIGGALLRATDRIERCSSTLANPDTGRRDVEVLEALEGGWGHADFGVEAEVVDGGEVRVGDRFDDPAATT